jgi:hypothetical protein
MRRLRERKGKGGKETLGWKRGSRRKGRKGGSFVADALGEIGIGGVEELEVGGGHGENPSFPLSRIV